MDTESVTRTVVQALEKSSGVLAVVEIGPGDVAVETADGWRGFVKIEEA